MSVRRESGLLLALLLPALLSAQYRQSDTSWIQRTRIGPGSLVRLEVGHLVTRAPEPQLTTPYRGHVASFTHDTLYLAAADSSVAIPRILITRMELSLGLDREYSAGQGAGYGLLLGILAGGIGQPHGWRQDRGELFGAGIGFLAGYVAGVAFPVERWVFGWLPP